jgi:DNA/RNA endonuclease G (NUC1)
MQKRMKMNAIRIGLAALWLLCASPGGAHAGETCGCDVAPERVAAYDAALIATDPDTARTQHAPYGVAVPALPGTPPIVLAQDDWLTGYDPVRRMPLWVAYRMTASDVAQKRKRTQCFRPDPRLSSAQGGTTCASWRGDGMDRGHMVASADMTRSE